MAPDWHHEVGKPAPGDSNFEAIDMEPLPQTCLNPVDKNMIPQLAHGLDRVVKEDSLLHPLRDLETQKFNFTPQLHSLKKLDELDLTSISEFVPPTRDETLHSLALEHDCKIMGSTSSVTPILSKIYLYLSNQRPCDLPEMSQSYRGLPSTLVNSLQRPSVMTLCNHDGKYVVSQFKSKSEVEASNSVLLDLGHVLESFLTLEPEDFGSLFHKPDEAGLTQQQIRARQQQLDMPQVYNFLKVGDCLFRSQLDCYEPSTDRVFDIKTRATAGIRYNIGDFEAHIDDKKASINRLLGQWSSYEREYYDLVRSKFLPFSLQLRIGQMDGAFLAYHNTAEVFGFQYVTLEEIEHRIYGSSKRAAWSFDMGCKVLQKVVAAIDKKYRDQGDLTVVTTIGKDHLDFYVDPEASKAPGRNVMHLRLELKREMNGLEVPPGKMLDGAEEDIKIWSSLTESEVEYSQYRKYLAASFWGVDDAKLQNSAVLA